MYDIIFTCSSLHSAGSVVRMAASMEYLKCKCLLVIVTPSTDDATIIADRISTVGNSVDKIIFTSAIDNMYVGRAWGVVWPIQAGLDTRYFCSCDDDLEFLPGCSRLLDLLDASDFSVMTFDNVAQGYRVRMDGVRNDREQIVGVDWVNGDSMFVRSEHVKKFGVADCLLPPASPMPYFVESEYQNRLANLTGLPIVVDLSAIYYVHHFRDDKEKVILRSQNSHLKIEAGRDFFRIKYNIHDDIDFNRPGTHAMIKAKIVEAGIDSCRHRIFDGLSPQADGWPAIYEYMKDWFEFVW